MTLSPVAPSSPWSAEPTETTISFREAGLGKRMHETPKMSEDVHEIERLMTAIVRSIPLRNVELPDEFFPAHLSVALIDSVSLVSQQLFEQNQLVRRFEIR